MGCDTFVDLQQDLDHALQKLMLGEDGGTRIGWKPGRANGRLDSDGRNRSEVGLEEGLAGVCMGCRGARAPFPAFSESSLTACQPQTCCRS